MQILGCQGLSPPFWGKGIYFGFDIFNFGPNQTPTDLMVQAIPANLASILSRIGSVSKAPIQLVAVSKLKPVSDISTAYSAGQRHFGENYVSELVQKSCELPLDIRWHFIGHLQSNKVKALVTGCTNLYMIETVDSVSLATKIDSALSPLLRTVKLKVLVEIKTSEEASKAGISIPDARGLIDHIVNFCPNLEFDGLMTIADPNNAEHSFSLLAKLKTALESDSIPVRTMSMGMSSDYESAIAYGSTEVRIGSSIFGNR